MSRLKSFSAARLVYATVLVTMTLLPVCAAHATPITLTFTGNGSGSINNTAFNGDFSFIFTADTTNIDSSAAPFYYLHNIGGTFSEGAYTATLTPTVTIVATEDAAFPRINFFNNDVTLGLGLNNSALATYSFLTSIGPVTTPPGFLTPTLGGGSFATTGGDLISFTEDNTLTFTASVGSPVSSVPEPSTITLLIAGLLGAGLVYRRAGLRTESHLAF